MPLSYYNRVKYRVANLIHIIRHTFHQSLVTCSDFEDSIASSWMSDEGNGEFSVHKETPTTLDKTVERDDDLSDPNVDFLQSRQTMTYLIQCQLWLSRQTTGFSAQCQLSWQKTSKAKRREIWYVIHAKNVYDQGFEWQSSNFEVFKMYK